MGRFLKVRNWSKWQSYRSDRGQPPWIKLHRQVLRNPEWISLSERARCHLVSIWILAADRDGKIPADPEVIRQICCLKSNPNLNELISLGFLEGIDGEKKLGVIEASWRHHHDAKVTPDRRQGDAKVTPQSRRQGDAPEVDEEEVQIREEKNPPQPPARRLADSSSNGFDQFWDAYPKGRKVGKKAALKAWKKLNPGSALSKHITQAITTQTQRHHFQNQNGDDFIPNPLTWLNQGRWDDEITGPPKRKMRSAVEEIEEAGLLDD